MAFSIFRVRQRGKEAPAREEEWSTNGFNQMWDSGIYKTNMDVKRKAAIEALEEDELGLRFMTPTELLIELPRRQNVVKELEGKIFHIEGSGSIGGCGIFDAKDGVLHPDKYTFDGNGVLSPGKSDIEHTVQVYRGRHPLSFYIPMRHAVENIGANFIIFANQPPSMVFSVVVGVKKNATRHTQQIREDAKIFNDVIRKVA